MRHSKYLINKARLKSLPRFSIYRVEGLPGVSGGSCGLERMAWVCLGCLTMGLKAAIESRNKWKELTVDRSS